jgi:hypothetical protein
MNIITQYDEFTTELFAFMNGFNVYNNDLREVWKFAERMVGPRPRTSDQTIYGVVARGVYDLMDVVQPPVRIFILYFTI